MSPRLCRGLFVCAERANAENRKEAQTHPFSAVMESVLFGIASCLLRIQGMLALKDAFASAFAVTATGAQGRALPGFCCERCASRAKLAPAGSRRVRTWTDSRIFRCADMGADR